MLRIQRKQNINISFKIVRKNGFENLKDTNVFIEYSNNMQDCYKKIENYIRKNIKCNVLTVFDNMIAHIISNNKLNQIATELFIRGKN